MKTPSLDELIDKLKEEHNFSRKSISFLADKGFEQKNFQDLYDAMKLLDETFAERRAGKSRLELMFDKGDSEEITTGRYNRLIQGFKDISSEQVLVQGRMKFAIEYVIALSAKITEKKSTTSKDLLVERAFTAEEKVKLRGIYENFRTKDYVTVKIIERKTNHDIVAANTWVTIRAQQKGLDDDLMRRIIHFARTSADVNTNVTGELYSKAIGQWTKSLVKLLEEFETRAEKYKKLICIAQTHGQDAQLTTLGHIYANFTEQIKLHATPLLQEDILKMDGKIAGAIGTDVDMDVAFPELDFEEMYKEIVENKFGLKYVNLGNDQDCSNASLVEVLDTLVNVGIIIKKVANDVWHYASRGVLAKITKKGESGSSAMPQKANPFFAEGAEALVDIYSSMINPIKNLIIAYRTQGDLRRSITKREVFHPIMLATIAVERLIGEIKKYEPNFIAIENEIYNSGPKVISSAINTKLRAQGIPDVYDTLKEVVMKPFVTPKEVTEYVDNLVGERKIDEKSGTEILDMIKSVMDTYSFMNQLRETEDKSSQTEIIKKMADYNSNKARLKVTGHAVKNTDEMLKNCQETKSKLARYEK